MYHNNWMCLIKTIRWLSTNLSVKIWNGKRLPLEYSAESPRKSLVIYVVEAFMKIFIRNYQIERIAQWYGSRERAVLSLLQQNKTQKKYIKDQKRYKLTCMHMEFWIKQLQCCWMKYKINEIKEEITILAWGCATFTNLRTIWL